MSELLYHRYQQVRDQFTALCSPLEVEDYGLQAMPETSPAKWHLAHTSWFFETFVLKPFKADYRVWHPQFEVLFNSYYNGIGEQFSRPQRHLLSRPTVEEIYSYRRHVDEQMQLLLEPGEHADADEIAARLVLGINHERQHQELFFTDLKYCLFQNPLYPAYRSDAATTASSGDSGKPSWRQYAGGLAAMGATLGDAAAAEQFCFDNETPRHQVHLTGFGLADRLVTNADYLEFIRDGGYRRPELWMADGWNELNNAGWQAPLYWLEEGTEWQQFSLHGVRPLPLDAPVCHVSAYEADAFARWSGARLPTEFEWEHAASSPTLAGPFLDGDTLAPQAVQDKDDQQFYGVLWQWTSSAYQAYPGYSAVAGAIGEYNGKFMCNQLVLRGGSCVSARDHIRSTYRNFFYPRDRWQFSGIRLAQ